MTRNSSNGNVGGNAPCVPGGMSRVASDAHTVMSVQGSSVVFHYKFVFVRPTSD